MTKRLGSVAAAFAVVAIAAGCGGSSNSSSSKAAGGGSGGSSGGSSNAASKGPIKILTYGDITGLGPTPSHQLSDGVQAAVNAFNSAGGVQGRKVQLIICDTKLNPAQAANCVAKASSEGIVAAIPNEELLDNVTTPLLEKQGIPLLGSNPSTAAAQYSKTSACFLNGPFVLYPAGAAALAQAGAKSISFTEPQGVADENILNSATQQMAAAHGAKAPIFITVPNTATNFSAIAAQATKDGEDADYISAVPPGIFSLAGDLAQAKPGIKLGSPGYIAQNPLVLGAFSKIPPTKGMIVTNYTAFPTDTSVPGVKLYQQQIATIDKTDIPYETALFTWVDAWGAMQILQTMTSGPINSATIEAAMKKASLHFQGVIPDWHYEYNTIGLGCDNNSTVYEGVYKGGTTITPLNGDKPVPGLTPAVIAYYKKALASAASSS